MDRWTGRKYWIKQIKVARAAISRSESRVQGDGGGGTMKRDTGDEIRMKLRYGRSNPWFSIRRVLSLPSLSLSLLPLLSSSCWTSAGQFVRVSLRTKVCNLGFQAEEGISFFCLSSFPFSSFPPSFFSSRVEIRDRCLTFSRIPSGTKSSGNSNSRGGIELRRIREFEKRNCARVVEIVESVTIKIFINTNGYIERNY